MLGCPDGFALAKQATVDSLCLLLVPLAEDTKSSLHLDRSIEDL